MTDSFYNLPSTVLQEDSEELDVVLTHLYEAAERARAGREPRWQRLRDMVDMVPGSSGVTKIFDEYEIRPTALIPSRVDRLSEAVYTGLTAASPYCQAVPMDGSQEAADTIETGIQSVIDRSGFDESFRVALKDAVVYAPGILWVRMTERQGLKITPVSPSRFLALPSYEPDPENGYFYGHTVYMTLWEAREKAKEGKWRDIELVAGGNKPDPLVTSDGGSTGQIAPPMDMDTIAVAHLLVKLCIGEDHGWWSVLWLPDRNKWLKVEKYSLSEPWYVPVRMAFEPNVFWPNTSPANRLQGLQDDHTTVQAMITQGAIFSGIGILVGGISFKDKTQTFKPGQIVPASSPENVKAVFPPFQINHLLAAKQVIETDADAAIGLSKLGTAQELTDATATEAQILKGAQDAAQDAYTQHVASALERIYRLVQEICRTHADAVGSWAKWLKEDFFASLKDEYEWKASGRAGDNAPSQVNAKLAALLQMSMNPASILSPEAVEEAVVRSLKLKEVDLNQLLKKNQDQPPQDPLPPEEEMMDG